MRPFFIFKGIRSDRNDIIVSDVPAITKPIRRGNQIIIPGRSGVVHQDEDAYANYTKAIGCGIKNRTKRTDYEFLAHWLDGHGDLILSNEPRFVYKATISTQIPITGVINSFSRFLVQFDVEPFKYNINAVDDFTILTRATSIYNRGTFKSTPIITVHGNGNIRVAINNNFYTLFDVDGYVTINSVIQEVYKDDINKNNNFSALDFPIFEVGQNEITWAGNVEKVEIIPNWRWL